MITLPNKTPIYATPLLFHQMRHITLTHPLLNCSILQQLLAPLDIHAIPRKTAPAILDANNLIRALLLHRNRHMMRLTLLVLDFQDLALLATRRVGAAGVCEFERRGAPEFKLEVRSAALMDVNFVDLAAGEFDGGHGVDVLFEIERGEAFGGRVAEARDGESARELGEAAEVG
jgi:hypothetical protein